MFIIDYSYHVCTANKVSKKWIVMVAKENRPKMYQNTKEIFYWSIKYEHMVRILFCLKALKIEKFDWLSCTTQQYNAVSAFLLINLKYCQLKNACIKMCQNIKHLYRSIYSWKILFDLNPWKILE